jgi:transcriptional regulator with XRE-family HTH domain
MNEKNTRKRLRRVSSWVNDTTREIEFEEDLRVGKMIVLKIVRYMEENHLTQKDLAKQLNVSPQYINKFLHGQESDIKVSTALRYGRILGIRLIEIPKDDFSHNAERKVVVYAQKKIPFKSLPMGIPLYNKAYIQQGINFDYN